MSIYSKKNVLIVTQVYPTGLSGTTVKTRRTLEYLLERGATIDVCCINPSSMEKNSLEHKNLRIFTFEREILSKFSFDYFLKIFHLFFTFLPFRIKKMYDRRLDAIFRKLLKNKKYDAVLFDGFSTLQYVQQYDKRFIYIDDEDITDLLWRRLIQAPNIILKLFFFAEYLRCKWYEKRVLKNVAQIWAISPNTKERLEKLSLAVTTLMPTVLTEHSTAFSVNSTSIVYTALLSWMENVVGLRWFLENCWHRIHKNLPRVKLLVSGQMADEGLKQYVSSFPNVEFVGFVPDLNTLYKKAAVGIAPILINAGIKVKILTYLSYGIPVVALEQATWGMISQDGVKAATEETFAQSVIDLLQNRSERVRYSKSALRNIRANHSDRALTRFFTKTAFLR